MAADKEKITIKTESKTTIRGYGIELNGEKLSRNVKEKTRHKTG